MSTPAPTTIREYFPQYDSCDISVLFARREELTRGCNGQYSTLPEDVLTELLAITRALRKRAAAPGAGGRKPKSAAAKAESARDSLA